MWGRPKWRGERAGDRALAARGGPVDGDDHRPPQTRRARKGSRGSWSTAPSCRRSLSARGAWRPATAKPSRRDGRARGVDARAAGERRAAAAVDGEPSPCSSARAPIARSPAAMPASRSDSLRRSSARPCSAARPARRRRRRRARIGYSSIIRGAIAGGTSMPRSALWRTMRSATGSPTCSRAFSKARSRAHLAQHLDRGRCGVGLTPTPSMRIVRARHDQGGDGEEGGGRGIAGDRERCCGSKLRLAAQRDRGRRRLAISGAERGQQPLEMVAGRRRLDDVGDAGRVERGEEQRRFDLGRGDVEAVVAAGRRDRGPRPSAAARRPSIRAPIRRSGAATRPIGRRQSEASPVKSARIGWLATRPMSSRAEVPRIAADRTAPPAGAGRRRRPRGPSRRRPPRARSARPSPASAAAVAATSPPSFSPSIRLRPTASAARIRARCEIDLSPGTRRGPA